MTVKAECEGDDVIVVKKCSPIIRKFTGQPVHNLMKWMRRQSGFRLRELGCDGSRTMFATGDWCVISLETWNKLVHSYRCFK